MRLIVNCFLKVMKRSEAERIRIATIPVETER